jgi:DNA-binding transcriptional regulator YiaG
MGQTKKYPRLITDPYAIRAKWKLSSRDFWNTIGVTASGGCKYEEGRQMPRYLEILFGIVYLRKEPPRPPKPKLEE